LKTKAIVVTPALNPPMTHIRCPCRTTMRANPKTGVHGSRVAHRQGSRRTSPEYRLLFVDIPDVVGLGVVKVKGAEKACMSARSNQCAKDREVHAPSLQCVPPLTRVQICVSRNSYRAHTRPEEMHRLLIQLTKKEKNASRTPSICLWFVQ